MYRLVYGFIAYIIVMYCIPLLTLTFTNYTLISTIYKRRQWLNKIQSEVRSVYNNDHPIPTKYDLLLLYFFFFIELDYTATMRHYSCIYY